MDKRTYQDALEALNTLQSNFAAVQAIRDSGFAAHKVAIQEMIEWCRKIGYEPSDFDRIKPIHVAGTKGKGSTSAFISSILTQYRQPTTQSSPRLDKVGLFTSPHLRFVRERIQINNEPLSEEQFARYFFELWDRMEMASPTKDGGSAVQKPMYFRYLTLMALHAYFSESVNTAIIECGIGGEYDSTNVLVHPTITAVTSLGIDHTAMLGSTIGEIAWQKAGIFKPGAQAFTVPQPEEAMNVLRQRASKKGVDLVVVKRHPDLDKITLGLRADFQKTNASLAVAVAASHLRALGYTNIPNYPELLNQPLPPEFRRGLEQVRWPGRADIRKENNITWHLDGCHTLESIELLGRWFSEQIALSDGKNASPSSGLDIERAVARHTRILVFNQQTRDANGLAKSLHRVLSSSLSSSQPFTHAVFCTNTTYPSGFNPDLISLNADSISVDALTVQNALAEMWKKLDGATEVKVVKSIKDALDWCREVASTHGYQKGTDREVEVLITGSMHLVGGALEVLETGN
ncbi:FolC bifunctional protein [Patellaria atrata CBS 101060]|uniref:Folylpolyglutamate synthase n=1 Tax=Patellaria atrata CBS 101060 TaxID=1346257 RepID=A0A9P4VT43_9PEZI|nr:FolC bifunctional protein [Patellaria atrata CBS 101060]